MSECKSGVLARRNRVTQEKGEAIAHLTSSYGMFSSGLETKRKAFMGWLRVRAAH